MKKTADDDRQTMLWRDFMNAEAEVQEAMAKLQRAVAALLESGESFQHVQPEVQRVADKLEENHVELRDGLNRLLKYQAYEKRLTFSEMWGIFYRRFKEATGIDVIARGMGRKPQGKAKAHLDVIQELGMLGKALDIAGAM